MASERQNQRVIDVRKIPTWERHAKIHAAFNALSDELTLTLITDHEPRPLRFEFLRSYPNGFNWIQRLTGAGRWEVVVRRRAAASGDDDPLVAALRCCGALAEVRPETLRVLADGARLLTIAAGKTLVEQDGHWPYLGFLRFGALSSVVGAAVGREHRLFDILPFDVVGEVAMCDGGRALAAIVATAASEVIAVPLGIAVGAMRTDAEFARAMAGSCAQRARLAAEALSAHVNQPALARVAAALLPFASPDAGLAPALEALRHLSQMQLAVAAGTAKEVAARALAQLEDDGAITRARGHVDLVDRARLQAIVDDAQR